MCTHFAFLPADEGLCSIAHLHRFRVHNDRMQTFNGVLSTALPLYHVSASMFFYGMVWHHRSISKHTNTLGVECSRKSGVFGAHDMIDW